MLQNPPFLVPGDTIAITAPASRVKTTAVDTGIEILKNWGFNVIVGNTVGKNHFNFAATAAERQAEFQQFLDDDNIKLILAARGGYGCTKFIDNIDFNKFKKKPKWICGFSDLTAIVLHINSLGFQAIHGPMAKTMMFDDKSNQALKKMLLGQANQYTWEGSINNKLGKTNGEAIGGNLCLLVNAIGTSSDISYDGKILFLEEISEYPYTIDRMVVQLLRSGKLNKLAGLVIGDFSDMKDNGEAFGQTVAEIILEKVKDFNYPVAFNFEFGHENKNMPIIMGKTISLEVTKDQVIIEA